MSVHPLSPHYVAFGLGDGTIRLLDRRKVGVGQPPIQDTTSSDLVHMSTHYRYRPSSFCDQPRKITSVQFNPVGSELLASYSEDYVYLYNSGVFGIGGSPTPSVTVQKPSYVFERYSPMIGRKRRDSVRHKPFPLRHCHKDTASSEQQAQSITTGTNEEPPPVKKFRLRGDWSDTGPNARPEGAEGSHEPRRDGLSNTLINRMSRMFAQWIDMSQSPEDEGMSGASVRGGPVREGRNRAIDVSLTSSSSSDNSSFNLFDSENEDERQNSSEANATPQASKSRDHSTDETNINESHYQLDTSSNVVAVNIATSATSTSSQPVSDVERTLELAEDDCMCGDASDVQSDLKQGESNETHSSKDVKGKGAVSLDGRSPIELEQTRYVDSLPKAESKLLMDSSNKGPSSLVLAPVINIIEGETDSDDDHDQSRDYKPKSHDKRHQSCDIKKSSVLEEGCKNGPNYVADEESTSVEAEIDEFRDCLQPFMVYKGHRNSRTMVTLHVL